MSKTRTLMVWRYVLPQPEPQASPTWGCILPFYTCMWLTGLGDQHFPDDLANLLLPASTLVFKYQGYLFHHLFMLKCHTVPTAPWQQLNIWNNLFLGSTWTLHNLSDGPWVLGNVVQEEHRVSCRMYMSVSLPRVRLTDYHGIIFLVALNELEGHLFQCALRP